MKGEKGLRIAIAQRLYSCDGVLCWTKKFGRQAKASETRRLGEGEGGRGRKEEGEGLARAMWSGGARRAQ